MGSAKLHRRHLTPGQQAAIVGSAQDWTKAQHAGRPENGQAVNRLSSVADRAAVSGASHLTQMKADKVANAEFEVEVGELRQRVSAEGDTASSKSESAGVDNDALRNDARPVPDGHAQETHLEAIKQRAEAVFQTWRNAGGADAQAARGGLADRGQVDGPQGARKEGLTALPE